MGAGVSLGALAMLHAQRRFPDAFAGLFLQSGSFFMPRFDAQESGFVRYRRIVRFVALDAARAAAADGAGGHDRAARWRRTPHDNRVMARALAAQGYPVSLHEGRDLHNYTAWRDAWDPHLTRLLQEAWR